MATANLADLGVVFLGNAVERVKPQLCVCISLCAFGIQFLSINSYDFLVQNPHFHVHFLFPFLHLLFSYCITVNLYTLCMSGISLHFPNLIYSRIGIQHNTTLKIYL